MTCLQPKEPHAHIKEPYMHSRELYYTLKRAIYTLERALSNTPNRLVHIQKSPATPAKESVLESLIGLFWVYVRLVWLCRGHVHIQMSLTDTRTSPIIHSKKPCIHSKEPHTHSNQPTYGSHSKKPCIYSKRDSCTIECTSHFATHCNTLQRTLQHPATHFNVLQSNARHKTLSIRFFLSFFFWVYKVKNSSFIYKKMPITVQTPFFLFRSVYTQKGIMCLPANAYHHTHVFFFGDCT